MDAPSEDDAGPGPDAGGAGTGETGARPGPAERFAPRVVWWITALHVSLLLAYSVLLPTYRAPDEPHHVDLAHRLSEGDDYPAWDEADFTAGVHRSLPLVFFHVPRSASHLTEDEALPRDERPSLEDLDGPGVDTSINQNSQHPPLYYAIAGTTERVVEIVARGDLSFDLEVWIYRLVSIALVAGLPLIVWRTSRVLDLPAPVGVAATLVPLAIPQLTHIGSAANNDSLLLLAFWLSTPVVLRLSRGSVDPRTAALAGVITGVGALTKLLALALPVWVAAALLLAWRRGGGSQRRPVAVAALVYGVTAFVVGGWWWLRNLVLYDELAPSRFSQILPPREEFDVDPGTFLQTWAYSTTRRFWGDFGLFDAHIPTLAFGTATVVVLVALAVALVRRDRVGSTAIGDRLLLAGPLLLLVGGQSANAFRAYETSGRFPGLQGRYWFGAVAATAVVVAIGLANLVRRRLDLLPLAVLAGAGVMQLVALRTLLYHFWGAASTPFTSRLSAVGAWSPLPEPLLVVGAVAVAVLSLAVVVEVVRLRPADANLPPNVAA